MSRKILNPFKSGVKTITIHTKHERVFVKEQRGYEGGLNKPMSWDRTVEKFHWLREAFAEEDLRNRIIKAVQELDTRPISDLMDTTRPGSVRRCLSENSHRHSVTVRSTGL
jgi:2-methylcitrate dehydratase PrpD